MKLKFLLEGRKANHGKGLTDCTLNESASEIEIFIRREEDKSRQGADRLYSLTNIVYFSARK